MRTTVIAILALLTACVPCGELQTRQDTADDACGASKLHLLVGLPFEVDDFNAEG